MIELGVSKDMTPEELCDRASIEGDIDQQPALAEILRELKAYRAMKAKAEELIKDHPEGWDADAKEILAAAGTPAEKGK